MMTFLKYSALFVLLSIFCFVECKEIDIWNRRSGKIWLGAHANKGFPLPNGGGWQILKNQMISIDLPDTWVGRFWPRTFCNLTNENTCETGGCGKNFKCRGMKPETPASLIEFRLSPKGDNYSISIVNGFNTKVTVSPQGPEGKLCETISCSYPFVDKCPEELKKDFNNVYTSGCYSPCTVYGTDEYCCKGSYADDGNCNPEVWQVNYAKMFKAKCPSVKTFAQDKMNVWHSCKGRVYSIIFEE